MKLIQVLLEGYDKKNVKVPALKPRNPNRDVLANKKNAGGPMRDKKKELEAGKVKHKTGMVEASLGHRVPYESYKAWKADLPAKSTFHKDGNIERAQAFGKDFEGVAGTWYADKNSGWIYAYYLDKENLLESPNDKHVSNNKYSVKLLHKGKDSKWPSLRGEIYENDVLIGTFTRAAVRDGYIPPIEYSFRTSGAKARFEDFADSLSIEETIDALLVKPLSAKTLTKTVGEELAILESNKPLKIKQPGWYVVDHMDTPVEGPMQEGAARRLAAKMTDEIHSRGGKGDIPAYDVLYFTDYEIRRAQEDY